MEFKYHTRLVRLLYECLPNNKEVKAQILKIIRAPAFSEYLRNKRNLTFDAGLEIITIISMYISDKWISDKRMRTNVMETFRDLDKQFKEGFSVQNIQLLYAKEYLKQSYDDIRMNRGPKEQPGQGNRYFNNYDFIQLEACHEITIEIKD